MHRTVRQGPPHLAIDTPMCVDLDTPCVSHAVSTQSHINPPLPRTLRFPTPPANGACTHMCVHAEEANSAASSTSSPCHVMLVACTEPSCLCALIISHAAWVTAQRPPRRVFSSLPSSELLTSELSCTPCFAASALQSVCLSFTSRWSSVTLVFSSVTSRCMRIDSWFHVSSQLFGPISTRSQYFDCVQAAPHTYTGGSASATSVAALPPQCTASSKRESPLRSVCAKCTRPRGRLRAAAASSGDVTTPTPSK